jgi:hypothetical protein
MAALPDLITVAQLRGRRMCRGCRRELPDNEAYIYELHHGEEVAVTRPTFTHNTRNTHEGPIIVQATRF